MNTALPSRAPRRLLLTLNLGEVPEHIPSLRPRGTGRSAFSEHVDGGVIDRLLQHHGGTARVARLHAPAALAVGRAARPRYDDIEQLSGVARVLRVELAEDRGVHNLVDALSQLPHVERVCADRLCHAPFDAAPAAQRTQGKDRWRARDQIRLPQALGYEAGDPAVLIGLADSGVMQQHAELATQLRRGFDTVDLDPQIAAGMTLVGDDSGPDEDPLDEVGHGTACAGILVAQGADMPPGAAGTCGLTPARVLGAALAPSGGRVGIGALSNIDAGMKRLIDLGVKVINMSFGTPDSALAATDPRPHTEIVRYALARSVILVAASGNSGLSERYYPAAHDGVIAVGAVDGDSRPCAFSTRGDHVALCAPGRDILTCGLDGYQYASGTSFAAPFATAVCGLLAARADRRAWPLTPDAVREILMGSACHFGVPGVEGCGSGVLDALAALQALDARIDEQVEGEAFGVSA